MPAWGCGVRWFSRHARATVQRIEQAPHDTGHAHSHTHVVEGAVGARVAGLVVVVQAAVDEAHAEQRHTTPRFVHHGINRCSHLVLRDTRVVAVPRAPALPWTRRHVVGPGRSGSVDTTGPTQKSGRRQSKGRARQRKESACVGPGGLASLARSVALESARRGVVCAGGLPAARRRGCGLRLPPQARGVTSGVLAKGGAQRLPVEHLEGIAGSVQQRTVPCGRTHVPWEACAPARCQWRGKGAPRGRAPSPLRGAEGSGRTSSVVVGKTFVLRRDYSSLRSDGWEREKKIIQKGCRLLPPGLTW